MSADRRLSILGSSPRRTPQRRFGALRRGGSLLGRWCRSGWVGRLRTENDRAQLRHEASEDPIRYGQVGALQGEEKRERERGLTRGVGAVSDREIDTAHVDRGGERRVVAEARRRCRCRCRSRRCWVLVRVLRWGSDGPRVLSARFLPRPDGVKDRTAREAGVKRLGIRLQRERNERSAGTGCRYKRKTIVTSFPSRSRTPPGLRARAMASMKSRWGFVRKPEVRPKRQ